ncbi:MAG: PD40 domain-containing protein [Solirubrobacterales bacterium]|mgnify:CR=1 FL=1|nr:PD40 domain-containing protein [Solirubrobacterales bacterium]
MKALRWLAAALLCLGAVLATAPTASAERYVAMGDSYSAGTGLPESDFDIDATCHRSSKAYGPLIKNALGAASSFRFSACTGARTGHITGSSQNGNPPQADTLGSDTLDATISIGGNDAGFGDVLLQCGYPLVSCDSDIDAAQAYITNTLPGVLDGVYNRIRLRAPNARVGVLGYPRLFPADGDDCSAATFFSSGEITRLNQTADMLSDVTRSRARAHGFTFVDSRPAFLGHAWCEDEWINGLSNPTHKSYHPNASGYVGFAGITRGAMLAAPSPGFQRGPNGRIAFTASRDGNEEIYVANADGSHPVNLTGNPAKDRSPSFSPDGMKIAFASDRGNAADSFDIWVMDWDGSNPQRLVANAANDFDPAWSPNGKEIVFASDRDGDNEIYKVNVDGSKVQDGSTGGVAVARLTGNTVSDFNPSFSPDGAEIVFQRYSAGSAAGQGNEVFKMNADGQGQTNLTNTAASVNDGSPTISPDGSQIAFHSNRAGNFEIYTMPITGGTATRRTNNPADDRDAAWAPGGTQIAFQSDRDGAGRIYTMTSTGSSQARRTDDGGIDGTPSWQGDSRPPVSSITDAPPANSNQSSVSFSFTSDEPGSTFQCKLDDGGWQACLSPFASGQLEDGAHGFSLRAIDPSGNLETNPSQRAFSIDTQAKVTTITGGPSGQVNDPDPSFSFESENPAVTFECRLTDDGAAGSWVACASPWQAGPLDDGEYRFEVRGTDGVGNVEDPPQRMDFQVDTVAPTSSLTAGPAPVGNDPRPAFGFTADEPGVAFECLLEKTGGDSGGWEACSSPFTRAAALEDGDWTFSVRATDLAGNAGPATAPLAFRVDTVAPESTIDSGPGEHHTSPDASFSFSANEAGSRFECRLDSLDDADWRSCDSPVEETGLTHGYHEFQVRAIDPAGNVQSPPASSRFGVVIAPNYQVTMRPTDPSPDTRPKFGFSADDPGAFFSCRLDGGEWRECATPYDPTVDPENPGQNLPPLADGRHTMEVTGTDSFGTETTLAPITWVIDSAAPAARILSGPPALDDSGTASFRIDPGRSGVTLQCRVDDWAGNLCPDASDGEPVEITVPSLHDAVHSLRVWSVGPLSGAGPEDSWSWSIDTTTPLVQLDAGPRGRVASSDATFRFSSNDAGATLECRLDEAAFAACTSPLTLSGLAEGSHRFEVRARDAAGNTSAALGRSWTIDTTGPRVDFTRVPADGSTPGQVEVEFEASEAGILFSCRLDDGAWLSCRSPLVVEVAAGSHRFEVRATDDLGNTGESAVHGWTAKNPPLARPVIQLNRRLKVKRKSRVLLGQVRCEARCQLKLPGQATVKVARKKVKAKLVAPRNGFTGRAKIWLKVNGPLRKALTHGSGRFKVTAKATSEAGNAKATAKVTLLR